MKKTLLSIVISITILLIYKGNVFAAPEAMQVNPAIEETSIHPGVRTSYTLTITNTADRPLGVHAEPADFTSPDEGAKDNLISSPLISWITIDPTDVIISPGDKKALTVQIDPPRDIKKGGYYAAVFLTPFISKQQEVASPIVLSRIGTLVLAQYGSIDYKNLKQKTNITDFSFTRPVFEEAPFDFHFTVKNAYFTHFSAKPFLTLTPLFGQSEKVQLEEKHILPGKSKIWNNSVTPHFSSLFYRVHLAVSIGAGNYITSDTYVIVIPGLHIYLLIFMLSFLALFATYHKRARKALHILFTGRA